MLKIREKVILIFAAVCLFTSIKVQAAEEADDRVLFISSYSYAWEQVQMQIDGIRAVLDGKCTVDYEFMDTKRVDDDKAHQLFYAGIKYRLAKVEPYDSVIVGDDAALRFALRYRDELFKDIPIVFEGVNDEELAAYAIRDPLISGVIEKLSVEKNVEFGLRVNPQAKKVVAILDGTITGEAERKRFYRCAEAYPNLEFSEIDASKLTTEELKKALENVSKDSILIHIVLTEDASGRQYTNSQAIELITKSSKVPTLRMVEGNAGEGILGGNAASMRKSGEMAAELARDYMSGAIISEKNRLRDSPNVFYADASIMEKYGIDVSVLPENTEVTNYQPGFFQRNREIIKPVLVTGAFLVAVLLVVLIDNLKRRKLVRELGDAKKIMESASEHDFLTGIPNRNRFMTDLSSLIENKTPCTVIMIDIDDFKSINDSMGHTAGDDALREVSARLKDMTSHILTPYRFAGDEFILILKSNQSRIVDKTALQCKQLFSKPVLLNGVKSKVCGSIGIASYPKDAQELEQLINCADDAMYRVKKSGKNDYAFYNGKKPEGQA